MLQTALFTNVSAPMAKQPTCTPWPPHVLVNHETASRAFGRYLAGQAPEPGMY